MVNIYTSTVAKDVFTWISLIILTIGILWALVFNILMPEFSNGLIKTPSPYAMVGGYVLKFGGPVLVVINLVMLYIYQIFWTPHKHLKGVDANKLNDFINEQKNK